MDWTEDESWVGDLELLGSCGFATIVCSFFGAGRGFETTELSVSRVCCTQCSEVLSPTQQRFLENVYSTGCSGPRMAPTYENFGPIMNLQLILIQ